MSPCKYIFFFFERCQKSGSTSTKTGCNPFLTIERKEGHHQFATCRLQIHNHPIQPGIPSRVKTHFNSISALAQVDIRLLLSAGCPVPVIKEFIILVSEVELSSFLETKTFYLQCTRTY
jgi:hypothetical protein